MGKKAKQLRECEECGELIESGNPNARLCKNCAALYQDRRSRDGIRIRPKEDRKKKKKRPRHEHHEDYYEEEYNYR